MIDSEAPFNVPFLEKEILDEITIPNYYDIEKANEIHKKYGFYIVLNCLASNKKKAAKWKEFDKTYINPIHLEDYYDIERAEEDLLDAQYICRDKLGAFDDLTDYFYRKFKAMQNGVKTYREGDLRRGF